jgi:O-antigen/teichoic acid export membrane protein
VPVAVAVVLITPLIFRRLIPRHVAGTRAGKLNRNQVLSVAGGNYAGTLFSLAATVLMPVLVANATNPTQTAYFYVPWMFSIGLGLIALNMTAALTVEAAHDEERLRQLCRQTLDHTMRLLLPLAAAIAIAAPLVLEAFGSDYSDEGSALLRLLALGAVPNVIVALGLAVARLEHRGRSVLAIQAAQALLVVGGSVALLPELGIEAVGYAWLASQALVAAALLTGSLRALLLPSRREVGP